jgi:Flp pilus assembly protein TadD
VREVNTAAAAERAEALLDLGRPDDAERLIRTALQAEPNDPTLLVLLSRALLDRTAYRAARDTAVRAVEAAPADVMALSCLAAAAAGQRKYKDALRAVDRAVDLAPGLGDLHRQRAEILLGNGDSAGAVQAARHARQLAPQSAEVAATLAAALAASTELDEAHAEATRALQLDPESARAHGTAGYVRLRQGGGTQSVVLFREALRLDPTSKNAQRGLTIALKSRNRIYRWLLLLATWMDSLGRGARWAVRLGPLVVIRLVKAAAPHSPVALGIIVAIVVVVFATWAVEPIANLVLMTNRVDRALLSTRQRNATLAFVGFVALAIGCFVGALHTRWLIPYAFGFGLWALVAGMIHTVFGRRAFRILVVVAVTAAIAGLVGVTLVVTGLHTPAVVLSAVLLGTAIPAAWTTSLVR